MLLFLTRKNHCRLFGYNKHSRSVRAVSDSVSFVFEAWTLTFSTIRSNALLCPGSNVPSRFWSFIVTTVHRTWKFALKFHDRSFTFHERLWMFYDRFWPFHQRFRPFVTFLWPEKLRYGHEMFRNGQERWTFRNGERSGMLDGLKRLQNQVHGTFTFTLQKRKKYCIIF